MNRRPVALIGAPTDVGTHVDGARLGPAALRVAGLTTRLSRHVTVFDCGDVSVRPATTAPEQVEGAHNLAEVMAWNRAVHEACHAALEVGRMPMLLGGDHCLAVGSISAAARHCRAHGKRLKVLWLDAHADFNTPDTSPSGNMHGMPAAILCGRGPAALVEMGGHSPALPANALTQLGVRSVDPGERDALRAQDIDVIDMRALDELGMQGAMRRLLADVDANTHIHVSFDVDFLDPSFAPAVGTAEAGGPNQREAHLCMEMLADCEQVGSVDVVELNPALDHASTTARVVIDLLESLFGKRTLHRDASAALIRGDSEADLGNGLRAAR